MQPHNTPLWGKDSTWVVITPFETPNKKPAVLPQRVLGF